MHKQMKLFLVMVAFIVLATEMLGPIYAIYVRELGGDILAAGTAWATFAIVSGIGLFIMGRIEDKIKKDKSFIVFGYLLTSLGFLAYFFVSNIIQLFLLQVLLGIGTIMVIPASDAFFTKYLEKGKFESEWAAWESLWFIVAGVAALFGAFLAEIFGFKTMFLIMFFVSLIGLAVATQLKDKND